MAEWTKGPWECGKHPALPDLAEALELAVAYFGAPSDGNFDGIDDDAGVTVSTKVRIGDIKRMRAALARAKGERTDG